MKCKFANKAFKEVKVKVTLAQALRHCTGRTAHRGSRGIIALPFYDYGTTRGWGVSVTPRPLFTPGKDPVPIVHEAVWAPGPVWTGAENFASTGIRSSDRPARSQSLYRLSYPILFQLTGINLSLFWQCVQSCLRILIISDFYRKAESCRCIITHLIYGSPGVGPDQRFIVPVPWRQTVPTVSVTICSVHKRLSRYRLGQVLRAPVCWVSHNF
jgi:hypothetical protein